MKTIIQTEARNPACEEKGVNEKDCLEYWDGCGLCEEGDEGPWNWCRSCELFYDVVLTVNLSPGTQRDEEPLLAHALPLRGNTIR